MDDAAIVALLSGIEPSVGEIPHPPFMAAVPAAPVIEAGADLAAIDAWVKARGGWTHRVPAHLAGPGAERPPLFFIVPKGHLHPRVGGVAIAPLTTGRASGGRPPGAPPLGGALPGGAPAGGAPPGGMAAGAGPGSGAPGGGAPRSGLGSADVMTFVATSDMPAARAFYERALGLRVSGQSPIACVFDANGTTLRVVAVEEPTIAPYTVLGWIVSDIAATIRELTARGVDFARFDGMDQDELGIWNAPGGTSVAWFKDPDGNVLSLTQFG
jgi:catechol 2,3-dioxygenase-like lactoylglutathione lyase family enzyme